MLKIIANNLEPKTDLQQFYYPALGCDIFVDWNQKRVVKNGLAKGTRYKVFTFRNNEYVFFTWATRKEIKEYQLTAPKDGWRSNA